MGQGIKNFAKKWRQVNGRKSVDPNALAFMVI